MTCPSWCDDHFLSEHPEDEQCNGVIELGPGGYRVSLAQGVRDEAPVAFLDAPTDDELTAEGLRELGHALFRASFVLDGIERGETA